MAEKKLDWRDCEFVSLAQAARIVGRSPTWTRDAILSGHLQAVAHITGGPEVVTVESLRRYMDACRARQLVCHQRQSHGAHLELVVNNRD